MTETNPPTPSTGDPASNGNGYHASGAAGAESADAGFSGSDHETSTSGSGEGTMPLWQRGFYMLGFGILAYVVFWVLIIMAIVQLIVVAIDKEPNSDLKRFAQNTVQYLFELMAFLCFASDDRPFPFGSFPSVPE